MLEVIASKTEFPSISKDLELALSRFGSLVINGIDDKVGLKSVKEAIQDVKKTRIGWEKKIDAAFAEVREKIAALKKDTAGEVQKFKDLEAKLRSEVEAIERAIEEQKVAEQMAAEIRFAKLTDQLFDVGFTYNGRNYVLGAFCFTPEEIDKMPDDEFATVIAQAKIEKERIDRIIKAIEAAEDKAQQEKEAENAFRVMSENALYLNKDSLLTEADQDPKNEPIEDLPDPEPDGQVDPVFNDLFGGPVVNEKASFFDNDPPPKNNGLSSEYKMGFDACRSLVLQIMLNSGDLGEAINAVADLEYS